MTDFLHGDKGGAAQQPLSGDLFSRLRVDILTEKLRPGEKLTEQRLCNSYAVSRTPVREALKQLEAEGLVEMFPNRGAFVVGFSRRDMDDMFALRKAYELQAVRWAVERITEEQFAALEETFEFMEFYTQKNDTKKMMDINTGFHQLIYNASLNRMLQRVLSSYQIYIKYSRQTRPYKEKDLPAILDEHREIFLAFRQNDAEAAVRAMERHISQSRNRAMV
ncbi:MAG: GntR family transcriptional regulator [Clostridiales Family XIII bacterium]|jgi:DNA-binding GntR family transcriptional regulator|nr:GntR family transcriptional regulator [Clostridiales Family XIII bacterium]